MPEIMSRKQAKEQGLDKYYTGKPCPHGHLSFRYTCNSACQACQTEIFNLRRSRYRKKKPAPSYVPTDDIQDWIAKHGVTRCPTVALVPTQAELPRDPRIAQHVESRNKRVREEQTRRAQRGIASRQRTYLHYKVRGERI